MNTRRGDGSGLVVAVERAYGDIRRRHAELPEVVILIGDGQRKGQRVNGHFAAHRWQRGSQGVHELVVSSQRLKDGAAQVLETLLHEAAHALCAARGVQDTSRGGRYHNTRYAAAAREVGLTVEQGEHGWHVTDVSDDTTALYAPTIERLAAALTLYTDWEAQAPVRPRQSLQRAECSCGRIIRASAAVLEEAPIICGDCGEPFMSPLEPRVPGVSRAQVDAALKGAAITDAIPCREAAPGAFEPA